MASYLLRNKEIKGELKRVKLDNEYSTSKKEFAYEYFDEDNKSQTLFFEEDGLVLKYDKYKYENLRYRIFYNNFNFKVNILLGILIENYMNNPESFYEVDLILDNDLLFLIKKYNFNIENKEILNKILSNPTKAYKAILSKGIKYK